MLAIAGFLESGRSLRPIVSSSPELRRKLRAFWAEYDRVAALRRRIVEAIRDDEEARFEFFCDHGFAPPVRFPDYPEFPPECVDMQCGAKAKSTGEPCKSEQLYRNGRCKFHGGRSTGPKSDEGKLSALGNLKQFTEPQGLPYKSLKKVHGAYTEAGKQKAPACDRG